MAVSVITTTSDVNVNAKNVYERNILERARPLELYDRFADVKPLPKGQGTYQTFMRVGKLARAPQLTEGVPPTGKKASTTQFPCHLVQFGDFLTFSDKVKLTAPDPKLLDFSDLLGEQAGETLDVFHRDKQMAGTQVRYANDAANRSSVESAPLEQDLKAIERILDGNNTKLINKMIGASTGVSTEPIPPSYVAITHTDARQDFESLPNFIPVHKYAKQQGIMEGEIGSWKRIRIICTTQGKTYTGGGSGTTTGLVNDGSNVNVYATLIFGQHFYGTMPLQRKGIENIVKSLGNVGFNPLNQFGTTGWKAWTGGIILNDSFGVRYEHGVSEL
jgi:N4-gp56 family major capsid protein